MLGQDVSHFVSVCHPGPFTRIDLFQFLWVRNLGRLRQIGSGAKRWLKLDHQDQSSSGWGWPLSFSLSLCLSLPRVRASPCGISTWAVSVCLRGRKSSQEWFIPVNKVEAVLPFTTYSQWSMQCHFPPGLKRRGIRLRHLIGSRGHVDIMGHPFWKNTVYHTFLYNYLKTEFQSLFLDKQTEKPCFYNL